MSGGEHPQPASDGPAMIFRYENLSLYPRVFRVMTGLTVPEFDDLWQQMQPRYARRRRKKAQRPDRQRAPGAGAPSLLDDRDQCLLGIVWLRRYPTLATLGFFFGVSETTALRNRDSAVALLEAAGRDSMRLPDPGKPRHKTVDDLLAETPQLAVVIDSFEQRVQRPRRPEKGTDPSPSSDGAARAEKKDLDDPDAWYSGKKKQHTIKSQVAVDEETGYVVDISASVPGPTADIKLLEDSKLMARLLEGLGAIGDLAYVGLEKLFPGARGAAPRRKPRGKPRPEQDVIYNRAFARRRVVVEHSIRRLRCYQCLAQTDREHRRGHARRVAAVAGLVNHQIRLRQAV